MNRWIKGRMNKRMNKWMNKWMNVCLGWQVQGAGGWIGWIKGWIHE